ncbi:MAG: AraC family transcriptional regulator [Chitinophagaceae bacterium]|nr:AraC family transcriptional regulator [Chitinophagaceae bacterium]
MTYRIHIPPPPLSFFVEHLFYYEGYQAMHKMEKFLPDGSMDLLIDLTETPKKLFHNETGETYTTYKKSWISGMKTEYILIDASVSSMIGVHFKPGGAYPFFNMPASELNDRTVETDLLWNTEILSIRDAVLNTPVIEDKFSIVEKYLLQKGKNRLDPNVLVNYAIEQLQRSPQIWTIGQLTHKVGITQKHLITLFKKYAGLSPKMFARISKFQKVIREVEQEQSIEWAPIAYECGYYDQAHFIKEFQAFSGINPSAYLSQKGRYRNYIPIQ